MKVLTPAAAQDRVAFESYYGHGGNCSCHLHPPCGCCTHPGNPSNQAEDPSAWMEEGLDLDAMEKRAREVVLETIERSTKRHLFAMSLGRHD